MNNRPHWPKEYDGVKPAAAWRRLIALAYDWVLMSCVLFMTTAALLVLRGGEAYPARDPIYSACLVMTGMAFFCWFWTHGGQTLGMRAWKIQVMGEKGQAVTWRQALIRALVALLSIGAFGLGFAWMVIDPRRRTWHDIASATHIIFTGKPDVKTGHDSKPSCPA